MTGTSLERRQLLEGIAREFLHRNPRGARLLAVAGADATEPAALATDLVTALRAQGTAANTVAQNRRDENALRSKVAAPLREARADAVTVVSGDGSLLAPRTRWLWHSSIWLVAGDEEGNTEADAIIDVTDPQHPTRRYAEFCQCDVDEPTRLQL